MNKSLKQFTRNFLRCGLAGWCMEILFTALHSLQRREFKLMGNTSVWMFPIYGCGAFIAPLSRLLSRRNVLIRGGTYMCLIYLMEYLSGHALQRRHLCPWDYHRSRFHIKGLIRLDYAPLWFGAGLLFERMTQKKPN